MSELPDNLEALKSLRNEVAETLTDLDAKIEAGDYDNEVKKLNEDIPELLRKFCHNKLAAGASVNIEFTTDDQYYGWIGLQVNADAEMDQLFSINVGTMSPWKKIENRIHACWKKYDEKQSLYDKMPPRLMRHQSDFCVTASPSIVGSWISSLPPEIRITGATETIATLEEELANLSAEIVEKQRYMDETESALQLLDDMQELLDDMQENKNENA